MGIWSNLTFRAPPPYNASSNPYAAGSIENSKLLNKYGNPAQKEGLQQLLKLLQGEGRVDPRLLAMVQRQNSMSTQQQQNAARGAAARSGFGNGGLQQALMAAIGGAGANRSANLNLQDISDSYARNQQNIGLMGQLVTQPQLGYASLSADLFKNKSASDAQRRAAEMGAIGSSMEAVGSAFGGGCWVAEATFGKDSPDTHFARFYVNNLASDELYDAYMEHGQALADIVERDDALKESLRPTFLAFGRIAARSIGG